MAITYTKKNTIWSFYSYGATKQTKSGKTHYPEYRLGSPMSNEFQQQLENKGYIKNKQFVKKED